MLLLWTLHRASWRDCGIYSSSGKHASKLLLSQELLSWPLIPGMPKAMLDSLDGDIHRLFLKCKQMHANLFSPFKYSAQRMKR